jgi:hypothetical protein
MSPPDAANASVHQRRLNGAKPTISAHANSVIIIVVSQHARLLSTEGQHPASGIRIGMVLNRLRILAAFFCTAALISILKRLPVALIRLPVTLKRLPSVLGLRGSIGLGCTTMTVELPGSNGMC